MGRTRASCLATDTSHRRMWLIALGAVGLVGCAPDLVGAPCMNDSNCPAGQSCVGSVCGLHPPDGSVGGGAGAGAGGGTGGGTAAPVCAPSCQPWMDCVGSPDAGSCLDVGLSLQWLSPAPSQKVGPMATVSLQALQRDGGLFTRDVPYALEDGGEGTLHRLEAFQAVVDMGKMSTVRTLHAGWASGPDASVTFQVVASAPMVRLFAESPPARAAEETDEDGIARWRKSDVAFLQVESDRPLVIAPGDWGQAGVSAASSAQCRRSCGAGSVCACFAVELGRQALALLDGGLGGTVEIDLVSAKDEYGNQSAALRASLDVTRLKWIRRFETTGGPMDTQSSPTTVAVGSDGTVYAGSSANGSYFTQSQLRAYPPSGGSLDGGPQWQSTNNITGGPMVGSAVYVATSWPGPRAPATRGFVKLSATGGGLAAETLCVENGAIFRGDAALARLGSTELPVAVGTDGLLVAGTSPSCSSTPLDPAGGTLTGSPSLIVEGSEAFAAASASPSIWKVDVSSTPPVPLGFASDSALGPANLFSVETVIGGGLSFPHGLFFRGDQAGAPLDGAVTVTAGSAYSGTGAVVAGADAGFLLYYGDGEGYVHRAALSRTLELSTPIRGGLWGSTSEVSAPLLGQGEKLYVLEKDRNASGAASLKVLSSKTLLPEWRWRLGAELLSQLNLDIDRDAPSPCAVGQPGVLYFAANQGLVTTVYAILVDSQGVDRHAPWPRHQHDPANTGNAATTLEPWTCP